MSESVTPYAALPLQLTCRALNHCTDPAEARKQIMHAIRHCNELILGSQQFAATFGGDTVRLVVLPEYFLTGFPQGESIPAWQKKACIRDDGPEYEELGRLAQEHGLYLSGNAYELDSNFPEVYFQTSFIIGDSGDVILRYRRLISMFTPSPHDMLDAYLDIYGHDSLFPVVETALGRLACVASDEILYPEIARAHALRGAEVICHSTSEAGSSNPTPGTIARQARAHENMVCVVSANSAGISGIGVPGQSNDGYSQVVDHRGRVLAQAGQGESMGGYAELDIEALRHMRGKNSNNNIYTSQRLGVYRLAYDMKPVYPRNTLLTAEGVKAPEQAHYLKTQQKVIDSLMERGII